MAHRPLPGLPSRALRPKVAKLQLWVWSPGGWGSGRRPGARSGAPVARLLFQDTSSATGAPLCGQMRDQPRDRRTSLPSWSTAACRSTSERPCWATSTSRPPAVTSRSSTTTSSGTTRSICAEGTRFGPRVNTSTQPTRNGTRSRSTSIAERSSSAPADAPMTPPCQHEHVCFFELRFEDSQLRQSDPWRLVKAGAVGSRSRQRVAHGPGWVPNSGPGFPDGPSGSCATAGRGSARREGRASPQRDQRPVLV
ncbi:hypothetical protein MBT84_47130 [Streptomyces sp. MBT84]|nr:hypothetical protein [Streptomyces sp. MBT84]